MVNIKRQIVPSNIASKVTFNGTNKRLSLTVHQTGNTKRGANAEMHARLQSNGNSRNASWHYQVDDIQSIQSFEDTAQCFHAGDGRGNGNMHSIAIEICINSDGDYKKAVENGAALVRHLLDKHNLSTDDIKQHYDWSGKNCPAQIRAGKEGITWTDFINMVDGEVAPSTQGIKWIGTNDKGKELIVDTPSLNYYDTQRWTNPTGSRKHGFKWKIDNLYEVDGSLQYRVQDANGRLFYTSGGSDLVKVGGTYGQAPQQPKSGYTGGSIVEYLNSIRVNSSFDNRRRLAQTYGISNYTGTASQNTRLLNLMRGGSAPGKTIGQMADEVIAGKHGNGHAARQRSLGVDNATYQKVRAEVNRRSR